MEKKQRLSEWEQKNKQTQTEIVCMQNVMQMELKETAAATAAAPYNLYDYFYQHSFDSAW